MRSSLALATLLCASLAHAQLPSADPADAPSVDLASGLAAPATDEGAGAPADGAGSEPAGGTAAGGTAAGGTAAGGTAAGEDARGGMRRADASYAVPCPEERGTLTCTDDQTLLQALFAFENAQYASLQEGDAVLAVAIARLAALRDPRIVPRLVSLSTKDRRPGIRLAALSALEPYLDLREVKARFYQALGAGEALEESLIALSALQARAQPLRAEGGCPAGATCADDLEALRALLDLSVPDADRQKEALARLAAMRDVRALPILLRASRSSNPAALELALRGLAAQIEDPRARERLVAFLQADRWPASSWAAAGLAANANAENLSLLIDARRATRSAELRAQLDEVLAVRAPDALQGIRGGERTRARAASDLFGSSAFWAKHGGRFALAADAALAGAYGGAATMSLASEQADPDLVPLLSGYGFVVGAASAAAVTWFALGEESLSTDQAWLGVSGSAWGAWLGWLAPQAMFDDGIRLLDPRHVTWSSALGQLVGLGAGAALARGFQPTGSDVLELQWAGLTAAALGYGGMLSANLTGPDNRPAAATLLATTALGLTAGGLAMPYLDFQAHEVGHLVATTLTGAGLGLWTGLAAAAAQTNPHNGLVPGQILSGAALGSITAGALATFDLSPSAGGSLYQLWAAATGSVIGLGGALTAQGLASTLSPPGQGPSLPAWGLPLSAGIFGLAGALSTAAFPDGIAQDTADLLAQPLFVGLSLYNVSLLSSLGADSALVLGTSLLLPASVSALVAYTAPYTDGTLADLSVSAAGMLAGAWLSTIVTWTVADRVPLDGSAWLAATALGTDVGLIGATLLNALDVDDVGWRFAYVAGVAAGTSLMLGVPGFVLPGATDGAVRVSDVMLVSTLLGVGIGLFTMPLIDFGGLPDVVPDVPAPLELPGTAKIAPTLTFLPPAQGVASAEMPLAIGLVGQFGG